ncbi:PREDICTED: cold-regulated 413 inner membrane protein 1, chloroplastic-like [Camelina sativa]|uniref:Cold-regulated 413 inner membrane protein 1, chloroplastic-like n=1 Tax=Camelina sativa TaxID=90675 RepID=A0ABM0YDT4_CAMSA|nr:PREDICTED: cold-regulated 413 inner membrane protein 1, chloroplastic-like [Camelina sativa]
MASLCLSSSRVVSLHHQKPFLSLKVLRPRSSGLSAGIGHATTGSVSFNPLRLLADRHRTRTATVSTRVEKRQKRGSSLVCYASPVSVYNLQWISAISCIALILARGTGIQKSVVVPLFALHAPSSIVAWIKGEYGVWAAFIALIVRLFFTFPSELELPFIALLLVIVAPHQVMSIRGRQEGAIISLAISCFLAFQHFSKAGSLEKAYEKSSVLATVAIIGVTVVSLLFLL